jgi:hypothetical protein
MAAGFEPNDVATETPGLIETPVSAELIYKFVQLEEIVKGSPVGQVCAYTQACMRDIAINAKVVFLWALKIFIRRFFHNSINRFYTYALFHRMRRNTAYRIHRNSSNSDLLNSIENLDGTSLHHHGSELY